MTRILIREGEDQKVSGLFFKAFLQAVLLLGAEKWVLSPCMEWALSSFQHRVAQRLAGRQPRRREERSYEYPLMAAAMEEVGFEEIGVYVNRNGSRGGEGDSGGGVGRRGGVIWGGNSEGRDAGTVLKAGHTMVVT